MLEQVQKYPFLEYLYGYMTEHSLAEFYPHFLNLLSKKIWVPCENAGASANENVKASEPVQVYPALAPY
jgi:hypothetical protein